jgi:membrane protease YdiL (CAAX protease family)
MTATATTIFEHLLAIYAVLVAPLLAVRKMRRVRAAGTAGSKTQLYRRAIFMQILTTTVVLALCIFGAIPMANLGLCLPPSWPLSLVLGGVIISYFAYTAMRLRPKAEKFREHMRGRGGLLLSPDTKSELYWFAILCAGSGITEELLYRGFLVFYISSLMPHFNKFALVLVVSAVFGLMHVYQGWRGVTSTAVSGLLLTTLYVMTGSLLLPAVIHSLGNLQAVVICWPQSTRTSANGVDS